MPQLDGTHGLVHHLEVGIYENVLFGRQAMFGSHAGSGQVVQKRGLSDPPVPNEGARLGLLVAKPTEDLLYLAGPSKEPPRVGDGIAVGDRITRHVHSPLQPTAIVLP